MSADEKKEVSGKEKLIVAVVVVLVMMVGFAMCDAGDPPMTEYPIPPPAQLGKNACECIEARTKILERDRLRDKDYEEAKARGMSEIELDDLAISQARSLHNEALELEEWLTASYGKAWSDECNKYAGDLMEPRTSKALRQGMKKACGGTLYDRFCLAYHGSKANAARFNCD